MKTRTLFILALSIGAGPAKSIVRGSLVDNADFPAVIQIENRDARCTGFFVGPRVVLAAAHCMHDGDKGAVLIGNDKYSTRFTHDIKPGGQYGIAVGLVEDDVLNRQIRPISVATTEAEVGTRIELVGYGPIAQGGGGSLDQLSRGYSLVSSVVPTHLGFVTKGDSALNFGDSGAPALIRQGDALVALGLGVMGNIQDTSYLTMLAAHTQFLKHYAAQHHVEILGITSEE